MIFLPPSAPMHRIGRGQPTALPSRQSLREKTPVTTAHRRFPISWTNEHFDDAVNYYYMDAQGNYPAEPSETATYTALYGTVVHADDAGIQRPRTGFQPELCW